MKKILITVLAASLLAFSACACGDSSESEDATQGTVQLTTAQSTTAASTTAATTQPTTAAADTTAAAATKAQETTKAESSKAESSAQTATKVITYITEEKTVNSGSSAQSSAASSSAKKTTASYSDSDAAITYKGKTIKLDGAFDYSNFGTPDAKQEVANCLTGGMGYAYVYGSVTINVYVSGGSEYVEAILVEDMSLASTTKGITGGSTVTDLTNAYGKPDSYDEYGYTYNGSNTTAMFYYSGSSITSMCFIQS